VNENTGNSRNDFFYDLLDNPADLSHSNAVNLQLLINEFPQSGLLRLMLAVKREEESVQSASAYVNPKLLYKIANAVGSLYAVSDEQIAICQKPGEAKPVLPLPGGLDLPNLTIDESNYFHVPIDPDLVYLEDEKAEIDAEVAEESETEEDAVPSSEIEAEVAEGSETEEDAVPSSETDTELAGGNETEEGAAPSSETDTEVAEGSETEEDAVPSSETDTEVAGGNETEEGAAPSSETDTEVAGGSETEEDAVPSSETDTEVAEKNETEEDAVPSSETDTEVVEGNETEEDAVPSSETDTEVAAVPSSETDTEVAGGSETEEDAAPSSATDTEIREGSETEENAVPLSETDTEVVEGNETEEDAVQSSEIDADVAEGNETEEHAVPSSATDAEAANESEEGVQTDAAPLEMEGDAADENQTEVDIAFDPVSESEAEERAETVEHPELSAEPVTEEITNIEGIQHAETGEVEKVENELNSEQSLVQTGETDTENTPAAEDHEHIAIAEQADNAVGETEDNKIGIKPTQAHQEIDDEVFEEIVSIEDIGLEQLAIMDKAVVTDEAEQNVTNDLEEIAETAAGDSYFVFEPTLPEDEEYHAPANIATQNAPGGKGHQNVSRYNDEKMPYSFMWWLDKTRKEHASIYQPFAVEGKFHTETVTPTQKPQPAADHLQQQYVENIFAVSAVVSDLNVIPPKVHAPAIETKADKIIEKFIHEEPQIKHPSKVKLDSENKAKKSSEDRDELVTETLAKIYTEQMLYHKAILTYKKLMLKFPEKSLYFAGQIEQLENKIN